ncbi:FHA domain-containing protein [Plantactinospora sonchi]|uniref:FHA domain-containing protein n=1 Tax=Plantactinospora sonchi TaxID=1544735 RepID=A0ABU7RMR9_9ACTN
MSDELHLMPLLTVTSGPLRGASFRLRPGLCRIGREGGVDVLLDDPLVSRRHAAVELGGGRALLVDTGSTNGTWLNDRRIGAGTELRDGDRIRIGHVELRFFDPGSAPTEPVGTLRRLPPPLVVPPAPAVVPVGAGTGPRSAPLPAPPGPSGSAAAALTMPTQLMGTPRRSRRMLLLFGAAALVGWLAWAYLALG